MSEDTVTILATLATIAGVLMAASPFLQIRRMRRTQSSNDVSLLYLTMLAGGFIVWLAYGYALGNPAMLISNTASLVFMTITILVALRYRRVGAKRAAAGESVLHPAAPEPAAAVAGPDDREPGSE
ncbi:MAG TPA: SemiSWEET family transporter [Candidatus Limnocylindrales bacterium]|nr:SemiSWEET family transporter [Candidatus Limnocylindrales bacterium]